VVYAGSTIVLDGGLEARMLPVGGKRPRYAVDAGGEDWVVAYRLRDPVSGGVVVYAPCLAAWSDELTAAVEDADCVLLDGTFLDDDELARATGLGTTACAMGHLPISQSLPCLPLAPGRRYLYTHLNNTNPLNRPDERHRTVLARLAHVAAEIAADGLTFTV
jgi:pyrroloquinoline quinone biosynthesis protein B